MNTSSSDISTFADLFCGIGGFHYAAHELGLECVYACDIDEACRDQYKHNFGIEPVSDIKLVRAEEIPDHDVLFAGFPCQPFSIIGDMKGLDDRRGTLYHEILRVVKAKKPRAVVLENVRQFSTISKGLALNAVLSSLGALGYKYQWKVLNALNFGLPQKRERVIIVGMLLPEAMDVFQWPHPMRTYKPLADILEKNPHQKYFVSEYIRQKRLSRHSQKLSPAIWHENKGGNISSYPFSCALRANASYNYLLVDGKRRLTPQEQLRLQGFPDRFEVIGSDSQIRKQVGNAVPIPMVKAVIKGVLSAHSQITRRIRDPSTNPVREFTQTEIESVWERVVYLTAIGKADMSGEDFSRIFAEAKAVESVGKPVGIADVVRGRCCWSDKSVKHNQPHTAVRVRLNSGRNRPIYSSGINDALSDFRFTDQSVLDINNNRVNKAKRITKTRALDNSASDLGVNVAL